MATFIHFCVNALLGSLVFNDGIASRHLAIIILATYKISEHLFRDKDDLVQKANGWLLREAGKTDDKRLEAFLLKHGARIPRTTLRYAIERFEEKQRKRILAQTKA